MSDTTVECYAIDKHLNWLLWNWNSEEMSDETPDDRQWWEFWKVDKERKKNLQTIGRYLLEGLDDFVRIARSEASHDPMAYKDTILGALKSLYDAVIADAKMPWWVKPFGNTVKAIVVNVIGALLIDFLMSKYALGNFSQ